MPSWAKPTSEQVDRAIPLLSSPEHERYFFSRLENPRWIASLVDRNVFKYPPRAVEVEGGGVRFPQWEPSRYLARMASRSPKDVAAVFEALESDNASIIGDLLKAALAMPACDAKRLAPAACRAARDRNLWFHYKEACALCAKLAREGEPAAALELAEALFSSGGEDEQLFVADEHRYREGLKVVVPALAKAEPRAFLAKLCLWLARAVKANPYFEEKTGFDYSYLWRPAIEEHAENNDYALASILTGCARHAFEEALRGSAITLDEALAIIAAHPFLLFERLRLHLINEFAEKDPQLTRETIMQQALLDSYGPRHEYALLVGRRFDLLTPEERATWYGWIDAGPDMSDFDKSVRDGLGREATEEDWRRRNDYWKLEKLYWVRDHLQGDRKEQYEKLLREQGEPELDDLNVRISSRWGGPKSPMTIDDFVGRTFSEVVERVVEWRPDDPTQREPSIESLGAVFEQFVATEPARLSTDADALIGRPALFVRSFLRPMVDAVRAGQAIELAAILRLCEWVVQRPIDERTTFIGNLGGIVDRDWQWTRSTISDLLEEVCKAKAGDGPRYRPEEFRDSISRLVSRLCRDPARPDRGDGDKKVDPRSHDYLNMAINSGRGKALEAALEYARWVANQLEGADPRQPLSGGFDSMPEVRDMLEWQVDNPSVEAMAIIGSRMNLLFWIGRDWLAENAGRLFLLDGIEREPPETTGWAAWNAFLVWVRPHAEFYRLFAEQFAYGVEQAGVVEVARGTRERPMERLGEHLILLYLHGEIGLEEGSIIRRFMTWARPEIRRHAISFVGRIFRENEDVQREVLDRFVKLWDLYWSGPGPDDAAVDIRTWLFGSWFAYGDFDANWSLERLEEFVEVNPTPEPDDDVMERLAKLADTDIERAVRIVDRMTRGDREGWHVESWMESAETVLRKGMAAGGETRRACEALIDFLGRRGYLQVGKLLKE